MIVRALAKGGDSGGASPPKDVKFLYNLAKSQT